MYCIYWEFLKMETKITLMLLPFEYFKHQVYFSNISSAWIIASQYCFPLTRSPWESAGCCSGAGNIQDESGPALGTREQRLQRLHQNRVKGMQDHLPAEDSQFKLWGVKRIKCVKIHELILILKRKKKRQTSPVMSSLEDAREATHLFWKQENKEKEPSILFCLSVQLVP